MNSKTPIMVLQEFMQKKGCMPFYEFIDCDGGMFKCRVRVDNLKEIGQGRTKKDAKQNAAQVALEKLHNQGLFFPSGTVINSLKPQNTENWENNVCKLQDLCSEYSLGTVTYDCISETGPPHSKQFIMKCSVGTIERNAAAGTKKLAKQLSAGKILEYFSTNVPKRVSDIEEFANLEKKNNDALESFSKLGDLSWRPNLGLPISEYHMGFKNSIDMEKLEEVHTILNDNENLNPVDRIESILVTLSLDIEWSSLSSNVEKQFCLATNKANPQLCFIDRGTNEECAKINTANQALEHIRLMLSL